MFSILIVISIVGVLLYSSTVASIENSIKGLFKNIVRITLIKYSFENHGVDEEKIIIDNQEEIQIFLDLISLESGEPCSCEYTGMIVFESENNKSVFGINEYNFVRDKEKKYYETPKEFYELYQKYFENGSTERWTHIIKNINKLKEGMKKTEVILILGKPDQNEFVPENTLQYSVYFDNRPEGDCEKYIQIRLNDSGRVIKIERTDGIYGPPPH